MASFSKRKRIRTAVVVIAVLAVAIRLYFEFIPRGVEFYPWTLARVDGPKLTSPNGKRVVRVYFNDAGAMHRGNHWTWVVEHSWLTGNRVICGGFLDPDVASGRVPMPLVWDTNDEVHVQFLPGRDSPGD